MSVENLGTKFVCDGCGREQIITVRDNIPKDWTIGYLKIESGWSGPTLHFCDTCWGLGTGHFEKKKVLLARLFRDTGISRWGPTK